MLPNINTTMKSSEFIREHRHEIGQSSPGGTHSKKNKKSVTAKQRVEELMTEEQLNEIDWKKVGGKIKNAAAAGTLAAALTIGATPAHADIASDLEQLTGYSIAATKTIVGYRDEDGKTGTDFQGCQYGRKIIFDDNTYLTCSEYNYQYSYRPKVVLLTDGSQIKMVVGDHIYNMRRY